MATPSFKLLFTNLVDPGIGCSFAIGGDWHSFKCHEVDDSICSARGTEKEVIIQPPPPTGSRVELAAAGRAVLLAAPRMNQDTLSLAPDPADVWTLL